jgi:hypothetical protein
MPLTQVKTSNLDTTNSLFFRNRIINGACVIDQRNAGASVTPASGAYTLDRWTTGFSQSSKVSIQQNAGSVTPPSGFTNYLGATVAATATIGATDYFQIAQKIEANNTYDFDWGLSTGKSVTLSFWARCSNTGILGGSIQSVVSPYASYPFTFTIAAVNTWQKFEITIPAPAAGTNWNTSGTSTSLFIQWNLACGSTYNGTANAWQNANVFGATGAGSLMGTVGNYLYITGVQLEVGTAATAFERRPYGTELALCQRYFHSMGGNQAYEHFAVVSQTSSTDSRGMIFLPVSMRTVPSIGQSGSFSVNGGTSSLTGTYSAGTTMYFNIGGNFGGVQNLGFDFWTGTAGSFNQTAATMWVVRANASTATRLTFSAEL